jgi:hypothetical protein
VVVVVVVLVVVVCLCRRWSFGPGYLPATSDLRPTIFLWIRRAEEPKHGRAEILGLYVFYVWDVLRLCTCAVE